MFDEMIDGIREFTCTVLLNIVARPNAPQPKPEPGPQIVTTSGGDKANGGAVKADKTVGRNDPCPCGSGKKYKNCCGKDQE